MGRLQKSSYFARGGGLGGWGFALVGALLAQEPPLLYTGGSQGCMWLGQDEVMYYFWLLFPPLLHAYKTSLLDDGCLWLWGYYFQCGQCKAGALGSVISMYSGRRHGKPCVARNFAKFRSGFISHSGLKIVSEISHKFQAPNIPQRKFPLQPPPPPRYGGSQCAAPELPGLEACRSPSQGGR